MYIIYLDESGTHSEARYFVLAGLAVFEQETHYLAQSLDALQSRYLPDTSVRVPFRASSLRAQSGRIPPPFDSLTWQERQSLISEIYGVIANSKARLFAIVMEKTFTDGDPYERGFEEVISRFDLMLRNVSKDTGDRQGGLVIVAESSYRENLELLAERIATEGHRWGETRNLADIPYFAPAKSTRLLQLADFVANAVFGRYEYGYTRNFDRIVSRFDQDENQINGLVHRSREFQNCYCPACLSRRQNPRVAQLRLDDA